MLEQFENDFYSQALQKFQEQDFVSVGFSSSTVFVEQLKIIQGDESTHSTVLQDALQSFGETPITSCKFNFDSVLTDVATMVSTARVVENVGVMAYLGGATLITDTVLLAAAGTILTVEARHQTLLNIMSGSGTAIPAAFDMALRPEEVLSIVAPFFDGACDLGIPANPTLTITNTGSVGPGTVLSFSSSALNGTVSQDVDVSFLPFIRFLNDLSNIDVQKLFCQMMFGGTPMSISLPMSQCIVPDGINGPVAIWITSDNQPLLNNVRDRASSQLVAGPTIAFIDTQPQALGQLVRNGGVTSSSSSGSSTVIASASTSTSTTTISPAEASAIIASVSSESASAIATASVSASVSTTDSAATAAPTVNNSATNKTPGKPNLFMGPSSDGKTIVIGWNNSPAQ